MGFFVWVDFVKYFMIDNQIRQYNWSILYSRTIDCNIDKIWNIITMRSNLEAFHPFCKINRVVVWPGKGSVDEIEYLNGLIFKRKFTNWIEKEGYDLNIHQSGKPASEVSWRLMKNGDKTNISIKISPYIFNQGYKLFNCLPFFLIIKPLLFNYLKHVISGLKWYAENDTPVKSNQFGKNLLFS